MDRNDMNRRNFGKLALAALGGAIAGSSLINADDKKDAKKDDKKEDKKPEKKKEPLLLNEPHVCRGLNTCKGKGKGGKNECAGQGACATAKEITCKGKADCAGLGGCGEKPGENACKGQNGCAVPIKMEAGWKKARTRFEEEAKKAKPPLKVGAAPKA